MATTTDRHVDAVCTALVRNAEQLASVLRQISDPTPKAIGLWSIGETANHVAGSHEYFMAAALGEATLESLDEVDSGNARSLADDPERDPSVLADRLETGVKELVSYAGTVEGNPAVEPFIGVEVPSRRSSRLSSARCSCTAATSPVLLNSVGDPGRWTVLV